MEEMSEEAKLLEEPEDDPLSPREAAPDDDGDDDDEPLSEAQNADSEWAAELEAELKVNALLCAMALSTAAANEEDDACCDARASWLINCETGALLAAEDT